jgi:hypothetical protein
MLDIKSVFAANKMAMDALAIDPIGKCTLNRLVSYSSILL